jgi:Rrf2 family iron-sulfur cluster assembly transcriptional regulator
MDEISVKEVLTSVGENINPAKDLVGSGDLKSDTVEFVLTKTYFENLGTIMQEYLTTTSVGDLIRKARGQQELPKSATQLLNKGSAASAGSVGLDVAKERPLS